MTFAEAALDREPSAPERVGRYAIYEAIAQGGMARVHLARLSGPEGFSRVVAVKRMHRHVLEDAELKRMFVAEARLAARVQHPNVVPILDVLASGDEIMIVMDYVHGESLQRLLGELRRKEGTVPLPVAAALMLATLHGLHAAHEARGENGQPLNIVHRDVTPHNVLVGADGVARVLDFGVAKTVQASEVKPELIKGKFSYMAPEVIRGESVTRQADVFSASTLFWELLTGRRLFGAPSERERLISILSGRYPAPRKLNPEVPENVESIVMRGLRASVAERYPTALEMAIDLERAVRPASQRVVGEWVRSLASETLNCRAELIQQIETSDIVALPVSTRAALGVPEPGAPLEAKEHKSLVDRRVWLLAALVAILAATGIGALAASKPKEPSSSRTGAEHAERAKADPPAPRAPVPVEVKATVSAAEVPSEPSEPLAVTRERAEVAAPSASAASSSARAPSSRARDGAPPQTLESPKKRSYAKDFLPDEL